MILNDGGPEENSRSQVLLEMWIYTQEKVKLSAEESKLSAMTEAKFAKSSKAIHATQEKCQVK